MRSAQSLVGGCRGAAKRSAVYLLIPLATLLGCGGKKSPEPASPPEAKPVATQASQESGEAEASKATVEETVRFIFNHAPSSYQVQTPYVLEPGNTCQVKIKSARHSGEIIETIVDFKLLNPKAFEFRNGYITVRATNGERVVNTTTTRDYGSGPQTSSHESQYFSLALQETRDAMKVMEALRHLITQCGGKDDLFHGEGKGSP